MWRQFWHAIKMLLNVENILYNDEFFTYTVDTPKKSIEQHRERKCLKGAIIKGKVYLQDGKKQWAHESVDKVNDRTLIKYILNTSSMN